MAIAGENTSKTETGRGQRCGATLVELLAVAGTTILIISMVTSMVFRLGLLSRDASRYQFAVAELSNQLERLTRMDLPAIRAELENLEVSDPCKRTLREASLTGTLTEIELGQSLTLELNWKRRFPGKPVQLTGWIPSAGGKSSGDETEKAEPESDQGDSGDPPPAEPSADPAPDPGDRS